MQVVTEITLLKISLLPMVEISGYAIVSLP